MQQVVGQMTQVRDGENKGDNKQDETQKDIEKNSNTENDGNNINKTEEKPNKLGEENDMKSHTEEKIERKVLPRTGKDYFNLKLILINLSLGVIFLAIRYITFKNKKKQTT